MSRMQNPGGALLADGQDCAVAGNDRANTNLELTGLSAWGRAVFDHGELR